MDIVHHTLIGGAGYMLASTYDQQLAGAAFLAGSVFPDLDVFFMLFGKRFYLRNHQGITHSLPFSPLYALMICAPMLYLLGINWAWLVYGAALLGLCLHAGLDWLNTFRIALFLPFSHKRYSLDAVFFIDSVTVSLTGLFYLLYGHYQIEVVAYAYPLVFLSYLIIKLLLHRRVIRTLKPLFAIPSSINPFAFYILTKDNKGLRGYLYNFLGKATRNNEYYPTVSEKYRRLAERSEVFRDMKAITRAFHITKALVTDQDTVIYAGDLAVRNFGGRFAKTVLKFDKQNRLVHEVANI